MSKLDEIVLMAIGSGAQPFEVELEGKMFEGIKPLTKDELKQKIKDLMLELIGYGSVDIEYDMEKLNIAEKGELIGRNELTIELRKKVREL